jgi:ribose transport system permease protein
VEPHVTLVESPEKAPERTASRRLPAAMLALVGVLLALVLANVLVDASFFSFGQLRNTLLLAAPLALFAGAQTLCMLTGGIDLSVTMTATAVAYVVGSRAAAGDSTLTALLLGFAVALVIGLINGLAIGVFGVNPLIMTLGMAAILTGVLTAGSQSFLSGATQMPQLVLTLGRGTFLGPLPWNLLVWAVLAVLLVLLLRRTGLGRLIYAIGDNRRAARLAGVRVWQVETAVYVIAALLGAVAGILIGGRSGAVDLQLAGSFLLPSVAAAVIGGTSILGGVGGYGGTVIGALILTVLDTMLTRLSVGEAFRQFIAGVILLALAWFYVSSTRRASTRRSPA